MKEYLAPVATIFVGIVAAYFTNRQWQVAKLQSRIAVEKLKYDTFDARYAIMMAAYNYIRALLRPEDVEGDWQKVVLDYKHTINQGTFFFSKEVVSILELILVLGSRYYNVQVARIQQKSAIGYALPDSPNDLRDELSILGAQLPKLFEKDLSLNMLKNKDFENDKYDNTVVLRWMLFIVVLVILALFVVALTSSGQSGGARI